MKAFAALAALAALSGTRTYRDSEDESTVTIRQADARFEDWMPLSSLREIPAAASGIPNPPQRSQRQRRRDHRRTRPHGWKGGAR